MGGGARTSPLDTHNLHMRSPPLVPKPKVFYTKKIKFWVRVELKGSKRSFVSSMIKFLAKINRGRSAAHGHKTHRKRREVLMEASRGERWKDRKS